MKKFIYELKISYIKINISWVICLSYMYNFIYQIKNFKYEIVISYHEMLFEISD